MKSRRKPPFDLGLFLKTVNGGRTIEAYKKSQIVFSQGDPGDAVFYLKEGKAKVLVASERGKEAVVAIHAKGDFFGEGCLTFDGSGAERIGRE